MGQEKVAVSNCAGLSNFAVNSGLIPRIIGGCPKSLQAMKLSRLAPQRPGTAPVRGRSRFCCQRLLNERISSCPPSKYLLGGQLASRQGISSLPSRPDRHRQSGHQCSQCRQKDGSGLGKPLRQSVAPHSAGGGWYWLGAERRNGHRRHEPPWQ